MSMKPEPRHIGDGVYVEFDGFGFVLKANSHITPTDTIYLEPAVMRALREYEQEVIRFYNEKEATDATQEG